MPFRKLRFAAAVLACWIARGADATSAVRTGPAPAVADDGSSASAWRHAYQAIAGLGFYERLHVGLAFQPSPASSIDAFVGTDFGAGDASVWDVGLGYRHALGTFRRWLEMGWDAKAMYWAQSSPDYEWKMMSLVVGPYVAHDVAHDVTIALDAGVSLNFSLDTVRKQNVHFEYPTRWNGSVNVALRYRFKAW